MESNQRKKFGLISRRSAVLIALLVLPLAVYAIVGSIAVWRIGWMGWLWWLIPVLWILTWVVARFWPAEVSIELGPLNARHWTPRDEAAAAIVQGYQLQISDLVPAQLTDLHFYLSQAQSLALDISQHYRPGAKNPLTSLTVPEVLAAFRLVADDLEKLALDSIPGSRILTIDQWQSLADAPKWIRWTTNTFWAASILLNPANLARYGSSRLTSDRVASGVQTELLATAYLRFIRQVGFYLIEMNSGRLRGGADAYRAAFEKVDGRPIENDSDSASDVGDEIQPPDSEAVTIALVGQTSSGKSSLINALTGSSAAVVNILPETQSITRYELEMSHSGSGQNRDPKALVTFLDTPGYEQAGATTKQIREIGQALKQADAVLLVMAANIPARQSDHQTLIMLASHYQSRPQLIPPPVIGVLTHINLLSPVLDWSPPYDWESVTSPSGTSPSGTSPSGTSRKAKSIAEAIAYTRQIFGGTVKDVIPVCTDEDAARRWGGSEYLIPALLATLNEAQSVSVLAAFEKALDQDRIKTLIRQTAASGRQLVRTWLRERFEQ